MEKKETVEPRLLYGYRKKKNRRIDTEGLDHLRPVWSDVPGLYGDEWLQGYFRDKERVSFDFVTERLAVGGQIGNKAGVDQLVEVGITHVIDMQAEFDDNTLKDERITVLWLPQHDDGAPRPKKHVQEGINFALAALGRQGPKVFCHCAAGINRGPTMAYAVLRAFGIPKQEAIDRLVKARPIVGFYEFPNYISSVEAALL